MVCQMGRRDAERVRGLLMGLPCRGGDNYRGGNFMRANSPTLESESTQRTPMNLVGVKQTLALK